MARPHHRAAQRQTGKANHGRPHIEAIRPTTAEGRVRGAGGQGQTAKIVLDKHTRSAHTFSMRSTTITVRIKDHEVPIVRKAARREGLSVSAYIRKCTMEDFRTTMTPAKIGEKQIEAINNLLQRIAKKEMGAGSHPVPPTPGATSTPPHNPQAGRKARERGTA